MKRNGDRFLWAAAVVGAALVAILIPVASSYLSFLHPRTPMRSLEDLPPSTAVHLIGVVTYADVPGNRFWIADDTGAAVVPVNPARAGVHAGETVSVDAQLMGHYNPAVGPASFDLRNVRVHRSRVRIKLPPPTAATVAAFPGAEKSGSRVKLDGIVEFQYTDQDHRVVLTITAAGRSMDATIARPDRNFDYRRLIDATVRVVGVAEQVVTSYGVRPGLWIPAAGDVEVLSRPPTVLPLESIRDLYRENLSVLGHRIRMRGRVAAVYPNSILIEDRWGAVEANDYSGPRFAPGTAVEVTGFPQDDGLRRDIDHSQAKEIPDAMLDQSPAPGPITTLAGIKALSAERAAMALPVKITGVVTFDDPIYHQLYVQDATSAIYVKYTGEHPEIKAGVRVRLTGLTNPGDYAPVIVAPKFVVEGTAALPQPMQVTANLATAGMIDSHYAVLEGIVHPLKFPDQPYHHVFAFDLYTPLGQVRVFTSPGFPDLRKSNPPIEDARVRMEGVFSSIYNSRRQLVGYQFELSSPNHIQILDPGKSDPFSVPATPIDSLLRFSPGAPAGHRVKVAGIVTLAKSGFLYLQDPSGGVEVYGDTGSIRLGQRVEAVGWPTLVGRYSPVLTDAEFHLLPGFGAIPPQASDATAILRGNYDSQLVTLTGTLLAVTRGPGVIGLLVRSGIQTFTAELDSSRASADLSLLRPGCVLRLTGVASAQVDPNKIYQLLQQDPVAFKLLLRNRGDIVVTRAAPYWTSGRTLFLLGLLSLLTIAILVWAGMLRRHVADQKIALEKAAQTAQAIHDLSSAMEKVSAEQKFDTQVPVQGSQEIAGLAAGFNSMLSQLLEKDRGRRDAEARLKHQAMVDELTSLPNRRLLIDRLAQSIALARRETSMIGFLYIDLDGFKLVNDSFGHTAGDQLLREVGQRFRSRVREADTLARLGGDEFTVILNRIECRDDAQRVAESLLQSLMTPFHVEGHEIVVGASIGVSIFPDANSENDNLLQQADSAMYAAKRQGKNQIVHFSEDMGVSVRERLTLENELRRAISAEEIQVHYQPEFDLSTNAIVRFEALARWTHPHLGVIPPLNFIPVAEECGLIVPLGAYIMERACRAAANWQQAASGPVQVAVNVSSVQFARDLFVEEVVETLVRTGLPAHLLQIEITESATLIGIQRAAATMQRLRDLGISVVMDDFGSGYSCLSYLPKLPFDGLKIDRSFVNELPASNETLALVQSILTLGHNLGMRVIVEGIEKQDQLQLILRLGGDEAQGYLLGRPTPDPIAVLRGHHALVART